MITALDHYELILRPSIEYVLLERATIEVGATLLRGESGRGYLGQARRGAELGAVLEAPRVLWALDT